jgi:hypothetical protein
MQIASFLRHTVLPQPVCLYHIFSHYLINGTTLGKIQYFRKMSFVIFSATFIWNISHSKKNPARYYYTCTVHRSSYEVPVFLARLNETWVFSTVFEKSSNTKFLENPSSCGRIFCADIQTDGGHTDLTKLIVSFRNCVKAPKKEMRFLPSHHVLTLYQDDDVSVSWRGFWLGTKTNCLTDCLTQSLHELFQKQ